MLKTLDLIFFFFVLSPGTVAVTSEKHVFVNHYFALGIVQISLKKPLAISQRKPKITQKEPELSMPGQASSLIPP